MGNLVRIRSEKDSKKIGKMTPAEKKIRSEWAIFRSKQKKNTIEVKTEDISKIFSKMFG